MNGTASASSLLEVDDLKIWFPTARGMVHAVDGVSFTLGQGETVGIVGESGSGKSVLARSIMRLTPRSAITKGAITFGGTDLSSLSDREARRVWGNELAMVFQNPMTSLNPVMRVGRQIEESLDLHTELAGSAVHSRAIELLRSVGIPEPERRARAYPHELSGGMRQRVGIAIAIACYPQLLLADEPTTALDVTIQRQILDLLSSLGEERQMAMILITHDLGIVAKRADRVMVMYGGKVVEAAPTMTLFEDPRHPYTRSLLQAIPRIEQRSHTRLVAIPGRPIDVIDPPPGCRFAPRCSRVQERCTVEDPVLTAGEDPDHLYACFYPIGSDDLDLSAGTAEASGAATLDETR